MSKTVKHDYDLLVIGAGAAGSSAATTVDKEGKRVGLVECSMLGGTCLNYGCDPTKTLLHILATRGDDLLAPIVLAMYAGLPLEALTSTILPYPTMSEAVRLAAGNV